MLPKADVCGAGSQIVRKRKGINKNILSERGSK